MSDEDFQEIRRKRAAHRKNLSADNLNLKTLKEKK